MSGGGGEQLSEKFEILEEVLKIDISKIFVDDKRIRFLKPHGRKELKKSLETHGQIVPIIVDEDYKLIAGFRRLMSAKELGWNKIDVIVKFGLTELEKFQLEFQENIGRKDLSFREISIAYSQEEKLYKKQYPQTVRGYKLKTGKRGEKGNVINDNGSKEKEVDRYSKMAAKRDKKSETTVKEYLQIGREVENPQLLSKETLKKIDEGIINKSSVMKALKKAKKKEKDSKKSINKSIKKSTNKKKVLVCSKCEIAIPLACPQCSETLYLCSQSGVKLKKHDDKACKFCPNNKKL